MFRFRPHGARIVYVAGSEGDLPEAVRRWLDQMAVRTDYVQDVYDALAVLATGTRPILMIVSIEAVDWSEMDFFNHVAALSQGTRIYVTSQNTSDSRIFAAAERGAKLFESTLAQTDLETVAAEAQAAGPGGLLAGSLRPSQPSRIPISAPPTPTEKQRAGEAATAESAAQEEPPIRLVTSTEANESGEAQVSVPWIPHPSRPRRTPPQQTETDQPAPPQGSSSGEAARPLPRMDLTPEEMAALLGRPDAQGHRRREQQS